MPGYSASLLRVRMYVFNCLLKAHEQPDRESLQLAWRWGSTQEAFYHRAASTHVIGRGKSALAGPCSPSCVCFRKFNKTNLKNAQSLVGEGQLR